MDASITNGRLLRKGHPDLPVRIEPNSQLSVRVALGDGLPPELGSVYDGLVLDGLAGPAELGRCRVERDNSGFGAVLVFLDELYDCTVLVEEGRVFKLSSLFDKLPLVISQKDDVRPEFRLYVADLIYDLNVWRKFFNEQDRIISEQPQEVARIAQTQLLESRGPGFFKFFDEQLDKLDKLVRDFTQEEHAKHGFYFRQQMWTFIIGAEFMKRTNLKPRGYAGDSEMMQMLYDNAYVGNYVFNKLMHRHPLLAPAAQAVRNRRGLVAEQLKIARKRLKEMSIDECRIMSLACGPARELEEIFTQELDASKLPITLFDQDADALETARDTVWQLERFRNGKLSVKYVAESVRTVLRSRDLKQTLGTFHFIYSMGLFDYLTPPVAKAVLQRMYALLEVGGSLAIGNYHARNPNRFYMAYWLDWSLYYRTEEELLALASDLPNSKCSIGFDESGCQMFLSVIRAA